MLTKISYLSQHRQQAMLNLLVILLLSAARSCLASECTEDQLNSAKLRFRDCLEDKKAYLLQLEAEEERDMQHFICSGLKDMSTGCQDAVSEISVCMGQDKGENLVMIHLNAIAEVLSPYHPKLRLRDCSVFSSPTAIVYKKPEPEAAAAPEPEYATGHAGVLLPSLLLPTLLIVLRL